MKRRWKRRAIGTLALVCSIAMLTACYTIPDHGPVSAAQAQDQQLPEVGFAPAPPKPNADPASIVAGFIAAGTGQANDYGVARKFLTPGFARTWEPDQSVLVYDGGTRLEANGNDLRYTITMTAQIGRFGEYDVSPSTKQELDYSVAKVNGQWRISGGPQGIVLGADNFSRLFTPRTLYFPSADGRTYIPDLRWFRSSIDAASVVKALVNGPSTVLSGGVTATPLANIRSVGQVSFNNSAAAVSLVSKSPLSGEATRLAAAQLGVTLQSLRPVTTVRLVVDGILATVDADLPNATYSPGPNLILRGDNISDLPSETDVADSSLSKVIAASRPTAITNLRSLGVWAGTTPSGIVQWTKAGASVLEATPDGIAPSVDRWGWIWAASASSPDSVLAARSSKLKRPLSTSASTATSVQAVEVSPDGYRLLELMTTNQGPEAVVRGIVRDQHGTPTELTQESIVIPVRAVEGVDATWIDNDNIAVLTRTSDSNDVVAQQLGGPSTDLGQIAGASAISGGQTASQLAVLLKNGDVATAQSSGVWNATVSNVAVLGTSR